MNPNCLISDCYQNCCNIDGVCPTVTGTYDQTHCFYFYPYWLWATWWIWVIISVGSLLILLAVISCIVACARRKRAMRNDVIIVTDGQYQNQGYNSPHEMTPTMGIPVYSNGQNAPLVVETAPIYR